MAKILGSLKAEFMRAQLFVTITVEKVLDLCREILASRDDARRHLTAAEEKVAQNFKEREMLDAELRASKFKLERRED